MVRIVRVHEHLVIQSQVLRKRLEADTSPKTKRFIAVLNGVEAGLLIYEDWGLPRSFIYEIFVLYEVRSKGIGTLLLAHAEMTATQLGRESIRLNARSLCRQSLNDEELSAWYVRKGYVECASEKGALEKFLTHSTS